MDRIWALKTRLDVVYLFGDGDGQIAAYTTEEAAQALADDWDEGWEPVAYVTEDECEALRAENVRLRSLAEAVPLAVLDMGRDVDRLQARVAELEAEQRRDGLDGQAAMDEAGNEIVRLRSRVAELEAEAARLRECVDPAPPHRYGDRPEDWYCAKSSGGILWPDTIARSPGGARAIAGDHPLFDRCGWKDLEAKGYTVVPVTLTEVSLTHPKEATKC